jgi:hypothetical protein
LNQLSQSKDGIQSSLVLLKELKMPNPHVPTTTPSSVVLTDAQLRAALYFGMGAATEGTTKSDELWIAAPKADDGTLMFDKHNNSGYAVGTMQTDMGQDHDPGKQSPTAQDLVNTYVKWANQNHPDWLAGLDDKARKALISDLSRTGHAIRHDNGRPVDSVQSAHLSAFLNSSEGKSWNHQRDLKQIDKIMGSGVIERLKNTALYQNATPDDQIRLAVIAGKVYNQNEILFKNAVLPDAQKHSTFNAFMQAIKEDPKLQVQYIRNGIAAAESGAEVIVALRHASDGNNPLKPIWNNMEQATPDHGQLESSPDQAQALAEYVTIKNVFLNHEGNNARRFIEALDHGHPYPPNNVHPHHHPRNHHDEPHITLATNGHDLVTFDQGKNGYGYALTDHGSMALSNTELCWGASDPQHARDDLQLTRNGQSYTVLDMSAPIAPHQHPPGQTPEADAQAQSRQNAPAPASMPTPAPSSPAATPAAPEHAPRTPADPGHPDHGLYQKVSQRIAGLYAEHGAALLPEQLENCTAAVMADMRRARMTDVNSMLLSTNRVQPDILQVFTYQGNPGEPGKPFSITPLDKALNTPAEQSWQRFDQATERNQAADLQQQLQQQMTQQRARPMSL